MGTIKQTLTNIKEQLSEQEFCELMKLFGFEKNNEKSEAAGIACYQANPRDEKLKNELEELMIDGFRKIDDWEDKNGGKSINPEQIKFGNTIWDWFLRAILRAPTLSRQTQRVCLDNRVAIMPCP
ncbi:MAG: hypothetical protein PHU86_03780 [Patescibacteria group bacterium]|nr:hypothetical protein [Patescibacteria group bacterium]